LTSRFQSTNGSTDAFGISFVVAPYAPAKRLPLPLSSKPSGRLRTRDIAKVST
jgi:hypothetical protein